MKNFTLFNRLTVVRSLQVARLNCLPSIFSSSVASYLFFVYTMIFVKLSLSLSAILFLSCVTEANQVGRQGAGVRGSSKTTAVEAVRVLAESANAFPVRVLYVLRSGPSAEKVKAPTARLHAQSEINTVPNTPTSRALHTTLSNSKSEKNKEKCTDQYCVPKWTRPRKNDAAERRLDPVDEVPVEETFVEEAVDPDEAYDYVFVGTSPDATDEVLGRSI